MRVVADFHLHSHYSQATSKDLTLQNLEKYGRMKGLTLLGTGDLTHPKWLSDIRPLLSDDGSGILRTAEGFSLVLSGEISLIYSQGGRGRRIHLVLLAPGFRAAERIQETLGKFGRLDYDGRPIFGKSCPEVVEALKSADERIEVIPAHIWTPWFSLFGSRSGFDSVEECFQDTAKHIFALETGLSSDPAMNWRLSALDKYTLVSNSDAHSHWPWRLGRECNILELGELTYDAFIHALRTRKGFIETLEFWPHDGKYHYDGHRSCGVCLAPAESAKGTCPKCGQPLTIGVASRVEELADRPEGFRPEGAVPFRNLIPLHELLAGAIGQAVSTKAVWAAYSPLVKAFGHALSELLDAEERALAKLASPEAVRLILANRGQKIPFAPGYDGVYGVPDFTAILGRDGKAQGPPTARPAQRRLGEY